jgi:AbrB family looped-hinge helix DNA binding protein
MSDIVRIDARGRVTLPASIRDAVHISEGMYVLLLADLERKEIRLIPFADPEAQLYEIHITLADVPGALAKTAQILARAHVDLLSSESRTLQRGKSAEWFIIADISKCKYELANLQQQILAEGAAKEAVFRTFPQLHARLENP